jgi:hypothetical protein
MDCSFTGQMTKPVLHAMRMHIKNIISETGLKVNEGKKNH